MTKIDLRRVLDLDAQATAGPWMPCGEDYMARLTNPIEDRHVLSTDDVTPQDAALIAYYRTAAPAMGRALQAARELHAPVPTYPYATACEHADTHRRNWRLDSTVCSGPADLVCHDCDPIGHHCPTCRDNHGDSQPYPCPTVKAIHDHLGEQYAR